MDGRTGWAATGVAVGETENRYSTLRKSLRLIGGAKLPVVLADICGRRGVLARALCLLQDHLPKAMEQPDHQDGRDSKTQAGFSQQLVTSWRLFPGWALREHK